MLFAPLTTIDERQTVRRVEYDVLVAFGSYAARCGVAGVPSAGAAASRILAVICRSRSKLFAAGVFRWHGRLFFYMAADDNLRKSEIISFRTIWSFFGDQANDFDLGAFEGLPLSARFIEQRLTKPSMCKTLSRSRRNRT